MTLQKATNSFTGTIISINIFDIKCQMSLHEQLLIGFFFKFVLLNECFHNVLLKCTEDKEDK